MPQQRKKVLFVDDDLSFLEVLKNLMGHHAGDNWEIFAASDTGRALGLMQEQHFDLLVLDVHMPVVDGLQFLSLLQRKYPNILKVILTGDTTEDYRAACLSNGAELFLRKPTTSEGWHSVYSTLNELIQFHPEEGFRGVLRRVGLQDVLQMECLARHSLALEVSTRAVQGTIVVQEGQIIHAEAGGRIGEEAFNYLMSLKGGEFSLKQFVEPATRTITGSWEFLLMEAARKRDEAHSAALEDDAQPAATTAWLAEAKAISELDPAAAAEKLKPQIEEVLICSAQGDVLYEWQCANPSARVNFLEFLSQKAGHFGQSLPLGSFERLEVQDSRSRVIARIQSDRAMLVRSSKHGVESALEKSGPQPPPSERLKQAIDSLLSQHAPLQGLLACGVRYPDESVFIPAKAAGFSQQNLEYALRGAADTFQVLKLNEFPNESLRWIYEKAILCCLQRADGIVLGLFMSKDTKAVDMEGLGKLFAEFRALGA